MVTNFQNGKIIESTDMQLDSIYLTKALFSEVNPIPVKAAFKYIRI